MSSASTESKTHPPHVAAWGRTRLWTGRAWSMCALALVLGAVFALPSTATSDALRQPLSATERAALRRGELVIRRIMTRRGGLNLIGGTSWQVTDRAPDSIWRALDDFSRYPKMLPGVTRVTPVEHDGNRYVVRVEHQQGGVRERYYVQVQLDPDSRTLSFQLDRTRPSGVRAIWGFLRVQPYGSEKSLLSYGAMADVGQGLVQGMVRSTIHNWMLRVPWTIKRHLQRR